MHYTKMKATSQTSYCFMICKYVGIKTNVRRRDNCQTRF